MAAFAGLLASAISAGANEVETRFSDADLEFFEKKVRPLLAARCYECHSGKAKELKGGLRLDSRQNTLAGGDTGPAVVPGNAEESLLIDAVRYGDIYQMPPKSKLPADEIAVLERWVELGVPWPDEAAGQAVGADDAAFDLEARRAAHWAWQPVESHDPPNAKIRDWPARPLDHFILARLEAEGIAPSPPAGARTLIRRLYFDLTGLPPSPEEIETWHERLTAPGPSQLDSDALADLVDHLLDSPRFGERWARHWLDLVRYAETRGHEFEPLIPNAYQYRDYVIRALNADVPYNDFVVEHIAGDLVDPPRLHPERGFNESILGTGFWFLGEEVHSPVDIRKDETDRMDNRLDVMTKTFLGMTVGCARCHDHKFDAIAQSDYYALCGFLISSSYRQVRFETIEHNRQVAEQLRELRDKTRAELQRSAIAAVKPNLGRVAKYLTAAREAIGGGVEFQPPDDTSVVFADFEQDDYAGWKVDGEAFGDGPSRRDDNDYDIPLTGFRGKRFVTSHRNGPAGNNNSGVRDSLTGKLTSDPFPIQHAWIRFLIGGGKHPGRECVNLVIDGKTVRTVTGHNSGELRAEAWDVREFAGKEAVIEVVDEHRGGWGHIIVDHVEFLDSADGSPAASEALSDASRQAIAGLAASCKLDADLLTKWVVALQRSAEQPPPQVVADIDSSQVVVDYRNARTPHWYQDGFAFGPGPEQAGEMRFSASAEPPILGLVHEPAARFDTTWNMLRVAGGAQRDHGKLGNWHRSGRTLRTPEFNLRGRRLWYLVQGAGRAYAAVNSHLVIAGPLHGALLMEWKGKPDQWRWVAHSLPYEHHRLHVEFSPLDDEPLAIAAVVQSEEQPPLELIERSPVLPRADVDDEVFARAAEALEARLVGVAEKLADDRLIASPDIADEVVLAEWLLGHLDLLTPLSDAPLGSVGAETQPTEFDDAIARFMKRQAELLAKVKPESHTAPAVLDGNGVEEHLLVRGNHKTPADQVPRRLLTALADEDRITTKTSSGRLELARQMVDPVRNPLVARVMVNRVWHHLFGRGIVPSVDNFGVLGQPPSHPELLDHLADGFVQDGWSIKQLIRSMVLSRTYRMASDIRPDAARHDPDNRLLHRMPVRRLEGEAIRDAILAVSGRLDRRMFGPSVGVHLTPFMEGRGRPESGPMDGAGRRSIYISIRRNFLSPMMLAFDMPQPFSTVGRRTVSNVPAQALILMNDPLVVGQSRLWAERLLADETLAPEDRIGRMYLAALGRPASESERAAALAFLSEQAERHGIAAEQHAAAVEPWADLCHVIFNLKEFIFVR